MTSLGSGGILCIGTKWKPGLWSDPGIDLWAENHDVWLSGDCSCRVHLGDGSASALSYFSNDFPWGHIYFLASCLYMCGLQQRAWRKKGTFWKGSSIYNFHSGRKIKRKSSQEPSGAGPPWLVGPRHRTGCKVCPMGRQDIRVLAFLSLGVFTPLPSYQMPGHCATCH